MTYISTQSIKWALYSLRFKKFMSHQTISQVLLEFGIELSSIIQLYLVSEESWIAALRSIGTTSPDTVPEWFSFFLLTGDLESTHREFELSVLDALILKEANRFELLFDKILHIGRRLGI